MDPRRAVTDQRLAGVRRIVAVTGGKGGIGKSLVASTLALGLVREGYAAGLLDLDFTGPCAHLFLGYRGRFPEEDFGVVPPSVAGVRLMSLACFGGAPSVPLRGAAFSEALLEMLAITRWGDLDFLVVDMPPGIGDPLLDTLHRIGRCEFLVVAGGSRVERETSGRTVDLLLGVGAPVLGVLENMLRPGTGEVERFASNRGLPYLGAVPFDEDLEGAVGDPDRLARGAAGRAVARIGRAVLLGD
jgi:ATP-binding protein involved in chromosome partitioning